MDLPYLLLVRWDQGFGQVPDLNVYGPAPTRRTMDRLIGEDGAFGPDIEARTKHVGSHFIYERRGGVLPRKRPNPVVEEVAGGSIVQTPNWRVTAAEVVHCQPQLTCLAYRLDAGERSIVFGGDTCPTDSLTHLATRADVLLHMCHFINGAITDTRMTSCCSGHLDAARTAAAAKVRTLVLVHITEQVEQPGIRERILHETASIFDGHIIFGQDLLEVPLEAIEVPKIR